MHLVQDHGSSVPQLRRGVHQFHQGQHILTCGIGELLRVHYTTENEVHAGLSADQGGAVRRALCLTQQWPSFVEITADEA